MRFKIYYLQIAFLFISINGYTQKDSLLIYKNIIHAEAGGIGANGSLNYERVVRFKDFFLFLEELAWVLFDYMISPINSTQMYLSLLQ